MSSNASLWAEDDCAAWSAALRAYPEVVLRDLPRLLALDAWVASELPLVIRGRRPMHVTVEELAKVTEWKMKRGVFRGRNLALVRGNDEGAVRVASEEAFALVPSGTDAPPGEWRRPIARLAELSGIGPATASAVLAAVRPDLYPFFDEVVAAQVPDLGAVAFTVPYYVRYAARLRERAQQLTAACRGEAWTAHALGQALWAVVGKPAKAAGPPP